MQLTDFIDEATLHGLMKAIMEANFQDAMTAQQMANTGLTWNETMSFAKDLEMRLSSLCVSVHNAMLSGELSPFKGYREWMIKSGYLKENNEKQTQ